MQKMTKKEIDAIARPFTTKEAMKCIGRVIKRRPGVYLDDDGSLFEIECVYDNGFMFWEGECFHESYKFENIIYDYVFENGSLIGVYI